MKPLELTWYPHTETWFREPKYGVYCHIIGYATDTHMPPYPAVEYEYADAMADDKRLTDTELAAEVHCMDAELEAWSSMRSRKCESEARDRYWTLHRFATTDSHDQEDA